MGDHAILKLFDKLKFVGEASSVKRNSADDEICAGKGSTKDDDLKEEAEGETSCYESSRYIYHPEKPLLLSSEHEGGVDEDSSHEAAPSRDTASSKSLAFVEQKSTQQASQDSTAASYPANPVSSIILEESRVENQ